MEAVVGGQRGQGAGKVEKEVFKHFWVNGLPHNLLVGGGKMQCFQKIDFFFLLYPSYLQKQLYRVPRRWIKNRVF